MFIGNEKNVSLHVHYHYGLFSLYRSQRIQNNRITHTHCIDLVSGKKIPGNIPEKKQ